MTALHLASVDDLSKLMPLVGAFHAEYGLDLSEDHRERALTPLLEGSPYGAVWIIGPTRAPIGYVIISFGWSVEFGGMDGFLDEIYIRPGVRGRGIATEVMETLPKTLADSGLRALHLEVDRTDEKVMSLYRRQGFAPRDRYTLMTRLF
ncbi:acetyltransferase, GNAT family protein [Pseudooceanicola batsensis HTCC2597]|uniref:Acetyltransferase, GNAT family protein n=1 Tax=Pseudooceanicola batsensis (strain ATCC BAA-863 / DSM 15984 / KCTC 12145 / HTCC2597) TaxID=252305 RepID=A3U2N8_PSEBH|nr:acetyltransferase, GNAT family protein [Pseudooceanicola batsensis HTCC2597]